MMSFNYENPDYVTIFKRRIKLIKALKSDKKALKGAKEYYKNNIAQFISDFGVTTEPRNIERGLPSNIPFILFPRQIEWVDWALDKWRNQKNGITEKSRDMGISVLTCAFAVSMCLFNAGMIIGFGSRKQEYVHKNGDLKSLFPRMIYFLENLPSEFTKGMNIRRDCTHMLIRFPNGSQIIGESGDNIGRGARASIYFVDESAFLERQNLVDAALSQTTNCRMDVSTPHGRSNSFAIRRHSGRVPVFTFHWTQDPRKNQTWYEKQKFELDPVTLAQEVDIDYSASVTGTVIPAIWVQAAIDAHVKLGFKPTGGKFAGFDVADQGSDKCAVAVRHGVVILHVEEWSGVNGDILESTKRAFGILDDYQTNQLTFDADGLGSGVRGDSRLLNSERKNSITVIPFCGSGKVIDPEEYLVKSRTNEDMFYNAKAQAWWVLRLKFQNTYRAIVEGLEINENDIISISSNISNLDKLVQELSQPTFLISNSGKLLIDKSPDGVSSPNLADSVMYAFAPRDDGGLSINPAIKLRQRIRGSRR